MSSSESLNRTTSRKEQCRKDILICERMGNKACARIARAEWQNYDTHLKQLNGQEVERT